MDYIYYPDDLAGYNLFQEGHPNRREGHFTDLATREAIAIVKRQSVEKPFFSTCLKLFRIHPFKGPMIILRFPTLESGKCAAECLYRHDRPDGSTNRGPSRMPRNRGSGESRQRKLATRA